MKARALLVVLLVAGCDRSVDDERGPPPPDVGDEQLCSEPLTSCEGKCIDLSTDDYNCGLCGWRCKDPAIFGHCEEGRCPPVSWCVGRHPDLVTCDEVCARLGQTCVEGPAASGRGCSGEPFMGSREGCGTRTLPHEGVAACSDPIPWKSAIDTIPSSEAACCCTQDPPS